MEKNSPESSAKSFKTDWAGGKPVKLVFQDGARFGRISDVRRCWAPRPVRPMRQAMLTHEYTLMDGAGWHRGGLLKAPSNIYL